MTLSTGKVAFPIKFDNGDEQVIYFNPYSKVFREKIFSFEKSIDERMRSINTDKYRGVFDDGIDVKLGIGSLDDMMSFTAEQLDSLKNKAKAINDIDEEYQAAIKAELDDIFESPISAVVFKYCGPLDYVPFINEKGEEKSELYIIQFIQALYAEMSKYTAVRGEAMQKYIGKYKKK